jgi:Na+/phosphate symporter
MELYIFVVVVLFGLAISDLIVGVSNDAVNFLNSAVGSRVAPRWVIMIVASIGMLLGVTFSSGMMEVARKGIFHPEMFIMSELMVLFLAVMLTDVILLDLYNTFGLPTSTTVSIVFELLGAALAISFIKIYKAGLSMGEIVNYINTAKALAIISGILLSIVFAFLGGALIQLITRLIFTFDFKKRLKRYGGVWGGVALTTITYFILIKGSKGASFLSPELLQWIQGHTLLIIGINFLFWAVILQFLLMFTRVDILKIIVLIGCGALAMAFAANDLVNFIGVPLAGFAAFRNASLTADPVNAGMEALTRPVQTNTLYLLIAGIIMVITLWISRKARTVTKTEISLGRQDEGFERFDSTHLSRIIVRMAISFSEIFSASIPKKLATRFSSRLDPEKYKTDNNTPEANEDDRPSFDLIRASVNFMVASALISLGTSLKLPLSTTYVTFMVAMGTSLSDKAWGRESAVYRITGVLTVIGGWFFTAIMACTVAATFAVILYYFGLPAIILLIFVAIFFIYRTHVIHKRREKVYTEKAKNKILTASNAEQALSAIYEEMSIFFGKSKNILDHTYKSVFKEKRNHLKDAQKDASNLYKRSQEMVTHFFRLVTFPDADEEQLSPQLGQTVGSIQEISRHLLEMSSSCYKHVNNNHKGLLDSQIEELEQLGDKLDALLSQASEALKAGNLKQIKAIVDNGHEINDMVKKFDKKQIKRVKKKESKTRISMLYLGILASSEGIANHTIRLLNGFLQTAKEVSE